MTAQAGAETRALQPYPSIKRRLMCMLYESLLLCAVIFFAGLLFYAISGGGGAGGWLRHAFQTYLFLVIGLYFTISWLRGGQTLAMKTWKLRLLGADGAAITPRQALLRYVYAWPCLALAGIGILYAPFDRDRRFLHDRLARTKIVSC